MISRLPLFGRMDIEHRPVRKPHGVLAYTVLQKAYPKLSWRTVSRQKSAVDLDVRPRFLHPLCCIMYVRPMALFRTGFVFCPILCDDPSMPRVNMFRFEPQVSQVAVARNSKIGRNMTHAQLQRRWTSRENPLRKNTASRK